VAVRHTWRNKIKSGGVNISGYIEHFLFIIDKMSGFVELWAEVQFWTQHSSLMLGKYVEAFVEVHQPLFYTVVSFLEK
jgi:hypothetical protein